MKEFFVLLMALALVFILSCSSESADTNTSSSGIIVKSSSSESIGVNTQSSCSIAKSSSSSSGSSNDYSSTSNGSYGSQAAENGQVYNKYEDDKKYTSGGLTIYMAEERDRNGELILTGESMLEIGTMSNGEVSLALPQNVNSHFLIKIDEAPFGMEVKPLGVEVWFYTGPLRLIDNRKKYVGDLRYYKKANATEYHYVDYWYFSENAKINSNIASEEGEYKIDAKKGWNKVYIRIKHTAESIEPYFTTDLSEVPDGLKWIVEEFED